MRLTDLVINAAWNQIAKLSAAKRLRLERFWRDTVGRLPVKSHRYWLENVTLATGRVPKSAEVREAAASWVRNLMESISLENWTGDQIDDAVIISEDDWQRLQQSFATKGTVLALGHLGSWDLCGAWACRRGMPVSSVAEQLKDIRFNRFLAARSALGMQIYSADEMNLGRRLITDLHQGRLVCLLADRDLKNQGVPVLWPTPFGGRKLTVPPGPAILARRTGADLMSVVSHYEGDRMRITLGKPIEHVPGREGLNIMMQNVITQLAAGVAVRPVDWHVFGRFFHS